MIGTKLYCKTLELAQVKDKPYIRQAWAAAGLVDDFITLTRRKVDGTIYKPAIWRLEFSIRSSVRRWYVIEERTTPKQPLRSIHHTLDQYYTRQQLLDHFAALIPNYFHFKVYERDRRKDRCPDKTLFRFERDVDVHYQLEHVATATPADGTLLSLLNRLEAFRASHYFLKDLRNACDILIHYLEDNRLRLSASMPWNADEVALLRLLVQRNTQATHQGQPTIDLPTYRSMVSLLVDEHAFFSGDKDHTDNI